MKSRVVPVLVVLAALLPPFVSSQVFFPSVCADKTVRCPTLSLSGKCDSDPTFMTERCPLSCNVCEQDGTNKQTRVSESASDTSASASPAREGVAPTYTTTTTTTSNPNKNTATKRRSIVNPDFECGGVILSQQTRRARQVPFHPDLINRDPLFEVVTASPEQAQKSAIQSSCGASVISRRFLLTAASCIDPKNPISSVRLGDLDLAIENETNSAPADYGIIDYIVFPRSRGSRGTRYNDIALLMTDREIQFNDVVFPYCISAKPPAVGTTVIAAGFGHYNETHKSTHVLEGKLQVMPLAQCEDQYLLRDEQRLRKAYPDLLQTRRGLMCAGDDVTGVCEGDEGGPLFREDELGRRFLEGITSFTDNRCSTGLLPGLFTAVADYVPFIDDILYGRENA